VENNNQVPIMYTEEQLMARLKFFIGICLSLTLFGIVFVVLYSLIFVTQPLNAISPIDQKFFELIVPIATFLTGTLSGIMLAGGDKDAQAAALKAANSGWDRPPHPTTPNGGFSNGGATASTTGFASGASAFGAPAAGGFGTTSPGFGAVPPASTGFGGGGFGGAPTAVSTPAFTAPSATATVDVATGYGGKPAPVQPPFPVI
jgi:hypothetical protein